MPRRTHRANGAASMQNGDVDVEALLKQLLTRPSDRDFLLDASSRLAQLTREDPERMSTPPILTMLMQLMKTQPGLAQLQQNVMFVISRCAQTSRQTRNLFLREGGIGMLIAAMTENEGCIAVQGIAFALILCMKEELTLRRETKGALSKAVAAAMDKHMQPCEGEEVREAPHGFNTQHAMIRIAACQNPAIGEVGGVDEATGSRLTHDMRLMWHGMEILLHIHVKSGMSQAHAEESINVIAKAMRTYAQQGVLQAAGCNALAVFASGGELGEGSASSTWSKQSLSTLLAGSVLS
jgi:hypothetical protein